MVPRDQRLLALHCSGQAKPECRRREFHRQLSPLSATDELLNEPLFTTLAEAKAHITAWKEDHNRNRPHSSLGTLKPDELAAKMALENQAA